MTPVDPEGNQLLKGHVPPYSYERVFLFSGLSILMTFATSFAVWAVFAVYTPRLANFEFSLRLAIFMSTTMVITIFMRKFAHDIEGRVGKANHVIGGCAIVICGIVLAYILLPEIVNILIEPFATNAADCQIGDGRWSCKLYERAFPDVSG